MSTVYSIGHSSHPWEHLQALLRQHRIEVLVDVRSQPTSRHAPQYRQRELRAVVEAAGMAGAGGAGCDGAAPPG